MTDRPKARRIRRKKDVSPAAPKPHGLPSTLSRIRLSLSFRIAAHFSFQLVRTFLPALFILTLAFAGGTLYLAERDISRLQCAPLSADGTITLSVLDDAEVTLLPEARTDGIIVGQSAYRLLDPEAIFTKGRYIVQAQHISGQSLLISLSLSRPLALYCGAAAALVITDLFRMFYFVLHRKRLQKSVLAPIRDITDMAATLSANNLSNRINIAGTKNELKDLATVINSMLDRIETSYNSQKQFVSDASHELRTPIAVIQGYASMLSRWGKSDPDVLNEGINAIAQETESMKELVESLLFLARHDKKTLMMEMVRFDAYDVAAEVQREAAMVTPEDTFALDPADHVQIEADRGMLKQVMRILCDNAVKYSPKGSTITLGVQKTESGCTLSMSDHGPGIPKEELSRIFERFYRCDSARKTESSGHGLGLSIARIIVMGHSGQLRVRSKVGAGTTFYVDLPLTQDKVRHGGEVNRRQRRSTATGFVRRRIKAATQKQKYHNEDRTRFDPDAAFSSGDFHMAQLNLEIVLAVAVGAVAAAAARAGASASAIAVGTHRAADVARRDRSAVADGLRREERQGEELIADAFRELLGGRNRAVAVAGNQDFGFREHLQNRRDADGHLELVVAQIRPADANRADHAFQRIRHNGLVGNAQQHIAVDADGRLADVLHAAAIHEQDVNRDVDRCAHTGEAGAIAQAINGQVADVALGRGAAAALEGNRRHGCGRRRDGLLRLLAAAGVAGAGVVDLRVAGDGNGLLGKLLLRHRAVIHALDLHADLLLQAVQRTAGNRTGAAVGVRVLVRIE